MSAPRALPWADLAAAIGEKPFEDIREALAANRVDVADRDAFLLVGPAGALLRELTPVEAPAEALAEYGALLHFLYRHWDEGRPVRSLDRQALEGALADLGPLARPPVAPALCYLQLPERIVWAEAQAGAPHEPLDGCFIAVSASSVAVLGILGFRPERGGFTIAEASARLPLTPPGPRPDGSAPFASVLPAGDRAGLRSVVSPDELVALTLLAATAAA